MNIVLIGFRCSGKTVVGKIVAREMGRDFMDTDELIEVDTGYSIEKIISTKGWPHFRRIEKKSLTNKKDSTTNLATKLRETNANEKNNDHSILAGLLFLL